MPQKSVEFVIIGTLKILVLNVNHTFAMVVPYLCNSCHGLMQKAIGFHDAAIVCVKGSAYRICFWYISKDGAIDITNNSS